MLQAPAVAPTASPGSSSSVLARPLDLPCGVRLENRIAKAAMSESLATAEGAPTDRLIRLYERFGKSGAGLLVTGHVIVDRAGRGEPSNVLIEDGRHLPLLRRWAEAAQAHGARCFVQLNHAGRQSPRSLSGQPVAPSAVPMRGFMGAFAPPRALGPEEIEHIVERFATAARVAKEAGFAGVQIHGAHGYLVSQFLSPLTNLRDDAWGGDPARRMRFLIEVVRAVRAAVGPRFPVAVKLNSADFQRGGFQLEDALDVARALEREGIDILEVSGGTYEAPAMNGSDAPRPAARASTRAREAYFLEYAVAIRAAVKVPVLLTGGMRTAAAMTAAIESGAIDLAGLARPMTVEPDLPGRLLRGTAQGARAVDLSTGVRKVDDMLGVLWFQSQMHRMADGLDPDFELSRLTALWEGVRQTLSAR